MQVLALFLIQLYPNCVFHFIHTLRPLLNTGICCRWGRNPEGTPASWHRIPWWAGNETLLKLVGMFRFVASQVVTAAGRKYSSVWSSLLNSPEKGRLAVYWILRSRAANSCHLFFLIGGWRQEDRSWSYEGFVLWSRCKFFHGKHFLSIFCNLGNTRTILTY